MTFENISKTPASKRRRDRVPQTVVDASMRFGTTKCCGVLRHTLAIGSSLAAVAQIDASMRVTTLLDRQNRIIRQVFGRDGDRKMSRLYGGSQLRSHLPPHRGVPRRLGTVTCKVLRVEPGMIEFQLPIEAA
jgi:hypothetical protein